MTPIDDFLTEKTLLDLAPPKAYIDGAAAAEHGSVRILEHDEVHLRAEVAGSPAHAAELRLNGEALEIDAQGPAGPLRALADRRALAAGPSWPAKLRALLRSWYLCGYVHIDSEFPKIRVP